MTRQYLPSVALGLLVVLLSTSMAVMPVAAASAWYGSSVSCRYQTVPGPVWEIELKKIVVMPPRVRALGDTGQRVGWRFILEGDDSHQPDTGAVASVVFRYRSPIQRATAYPDRKAEFSRMRVAVDAPAWTMPGFHREYLFRVWIKVFWYNSDGTIQQTDKQFVRAYGLSVDGQPWMGGMYGCGGRMGHVLPEYWE